MLNRIVDIVLRTASGLHVCSLPLGILASVVSAAATGQPAFVPLADPGFPLEQIGYLKAPNAEAYDHFACGGASPSHTGNSIAISRDGRTMAIGAPHESGGATGINADPDDNSLFGAGAVYVFAREGNAWVQQAYVKASSPGLLDHFGSSVALSSDGNTLAVAAHFESSGATGVDGDQDDDSVPQSGAVYVFTRSGGDWTQQAYIKASNTGRAPLGDDDLGDGDQFGYALALSGDGNTLAVGAIAEDSGAREIDGDQTDDSVISTGAVYVFTRTGGRWNQQAYLKASNSDQGDLFGFAVAISADGNTLVASSYDEDGGTRLINGPADDNSRRASGALFVFEREGAVWTETTYLKGSRNEETDQLGYSVAISDDGNTIASGVGDEDCLTPGVNPPGCTDDSMPRVGGNVWVGAAYVFVRSGDTWTEQAFIKATNPRPYNSFGVKIALSGDGNTLAVPAYLEDEGVRGIYAPDPSPLMIVPNLDAWRAEVDQAVESGAVYLYTREGEAWTARAYIKASNADVGDEFGSAVALSVDGRLLAVGAHNEGSAARGLDGNQDDNTAPQSGAVYLFGR